MTSPMTCCAGTRPGWPPRARSCPRQHLQEQRRARPARPSQGPQGAGQGTQGRQAGAGSPRQSGKAGTKRRPAGAEGRCGRGHGQRTGDRRRARQAPGRVGLRPRPGPRGPPGVPRRGLRRPPPRPRAARAGRRRQGIPRREGQRPGSTPAPGVLLARHPAERRPARRGQEDERDHCHRPGHRADRPGRGVPDRGRTALPGGPEPAGAGPRRARHLRHQGQPAPHLPGPGRHRLGADPRHRGHLRKAGRGRIETRSIQVTAASARA